MSNQFSVIPNQSQQAFMALFDKLTLKCKWKYKE